MSEARGRLRPSRRAWARAAATAALAALVVPLAATGAAADEVLPPPVVTGSPTSPGTVPSPVFSFTADDPTECAFGPVGEEPAFADCTSPYAGSTGADGHYVFSVRAATALDTSPTVMRAYALDTTATAEVTGPTGPANDRSPTWAVALEDGATATCAVDGATPSPCTTTWTADLSAETGDGSHALVVTVTDALGNLDRVRADYLLDVTAPAAPAVTGMPAAGRVPTGTWAFDGEPGATAVCALLSDGEVAAVRTGCTSPASFALSGDVVHALRVTPTDAAGNTGPAGTSADHLLDTTAPAEPVVTGEPVSPATSRTPVWTLGPAPGDAALECQLRAGAAPLGDWVPCDGTVEGDLTGRADGPVLLAVRAVDAVGNTGPAATSSPYVLDTTGPAAPVVSGPSGRGTAAPVWSWQEEPGGTASCVVERDGVRGPAADCTGEALTADVPDGEVRLLVTLADALGNTGEEGASPRYVRDTAAPAAAVVTGASGPTRTPSATWTVSAEAGSSATCRLVEGTGDGAVAGAAAPCALGDVTLALPRDGAWRLEVQVADAAGNTDGQWAAGPAVLLDRVAPAAPVLTGPPTPGSDATPTWGVTAAGGTTACTVRDAGGAVVVRAPCSDGLTVDLAGRADGRYVLTAVTTDAAGNASPAATSAYVLDTALPEQPVVRGPAGPGRDTTPTWTWDVVPGETAECRLVEGGTPGAWTSCPGGTATRSPAQGEVVLEVRLRDAAGNTGPAGASPVYVLDSLAPAAPVVSGPAGDTAVATATWSWTSEPGAAVSCRLVRDGAPAALAPCPGGSRTAALADGTWVLEVQQVDAAGGVSPLGSSAALRVDTAAPAAPVVTGPTGAGRTAGATWNIAAEPGAVLTCRLVRDGVRQPAAGCGTALAVTLPADGLWALEVVQADAAGNASPAGRSGDYLLDRVAPVAPTVTGPTGPSADPSPVFAVAAEPGTTTCRVVRGGTVVRPYAPCGGSVPLALGPDDPDGRYAVEARTTDAAGNAGAVGRSLDYAYDTTAPAAPAVVGPSGPSRDTTPTWTWAAADGDRSTCRLQRDGVPVGAAAPCVSPFTPAPLAPDGDWALAVALTDAAGNAGPAGTSPVHRLDTAAPAAPVVRAPAATGASRAPVFTADLEPGAATTCRLVAPDGSSGPLAPCALPLAVDLTGGAQGAYRLEVVATDAAGGASPAGSATYVLDDVAPEPAVVTAVGSPGRTRTAVFTVAAPADATATTTCVLVSPAGVRAAPVACGGTARFDLAGGADGGWRLEVARTDLAGNAAPTASAVWVLDTTAPAPVVVTEQPGDPSSADTWTWRWTAEAGARQTCRVTGPTGGVVLGSGTAGAPCDGTATVDTRTLPDGAYSFVLVVTDAAGNSTTRTATHVLDRRAPLLELAPPAPTSGRTPVWTVTSDPGRTPTCTLTRAGAVVAAGPCTGSFAPDLATAAQGTYLLTAVVTSPAGVTSTATSSYVLDTVAPVAGVAVGRTPTNDARPVFVLTTTEPGATASCRVSGPALRTPPCSASPDGTALPLDLTAAPDGAYAVELVLVDGAGNTGTATATWVLDRVAPAPAGLPVPARTDDDPAPRVPLTGVEPGASLECALAPPGGDAVAVPCADPTGVVLGPLVANGTWQLTVVLVDAAGNRSAPVTATYAYDDVDPVVRDLVLSEPASRATARTLTWAFAAEGAPGSVLTCALTRDDAPVPFALPACTGSPFTVVLPASAPDGTYRLTVVETDAAGNASAPVSAQYVLDATPPAVPVLLEQPIGPSSAAVATWRVEGDPDAATRTCTLRRDGAVVGTAAAPCGETVVRDLRASGEGAYVLEVVALDDLGNASAAVRSRTYTYALDAVGLLRWTSWPGQRVPAPGAPAGETGSVGFAQSAAPFVFSSEPDASFSCTLVRGPQLATAALVESRSCGTGTPGTGRYELPAEAARTEGTYWLTVSTSAPGAPEPGRSVQSFTLDLVAPTAPVFTSDTGYSSTRTPDFSWRATAGEVSTGYRAFCRLLLGTTPTGGWVDCTAPGGAWSTPLPGPGAWRLEVRWVDQAGRRSPTATSATYTYDPSVPPGPQISGPSSGTVGSASSVTWAFAPPPGVVRVTCALLLDGRPVVGDAPCPTGRFTFDLRGAAVGTYTLTVSYYNQAGTRSFGSARYAYARPVVAPTPSPGPPAPQPGPPPQGTPPPAPRPPVLDRPVPLLPVDEPVVPGVPVDPAAVPGAAPEAPAAEEAEAPSPVSEPLVPGVPGAIDRAIRGVIGETISKPTLPLALLFVVLLFLLVQNRIDRRDPKLAAAPVDAEPDMDFGPTWRPPTGGAA